MRDPYVDAMLDLRVHSHKRGVNCGVRFSQLF